MATTIRDLESRQNKLFTDAQAILFGESVTSEQRAQAKQMIADANALQEDIDSLRAIETFQKTQASFVPSPRPVGAGNGSERSNEDRKAAFNEAFRTYARFGLGALNAEQRDLVTTSDATGGALIPQAFSGILVDALKFYGPIASKVSLKVTDNKGIPLKISYSNDTANGLTLLGTEGSTAPTETDPTFFSKILGVDTVTGGLVKVSFQELEDSSFDLDSFIRQHFAIRYARGMEKAITLGADSAGTVLPNQPTGGLLALAAVGDTTTSLANGIGWDDLTAAFGALDPAYIGPDTSWVMNSNTRAYLIGLKDGFGRPYFTPDPTEDGPFAKLMGYDLVLNQSMPNMGASATPILFGDLKKAYLLRTDGQPSILRLNERYADTLEVGFYMYTRVGGVTLNAGINPLVGIKQASS